MSVSPCPNLPVPALDWNAAWQAARRKKSHDHHGSAFWNKRAASFARNAHNSNYAQLFLSQLAPQPQWSVLDVGCGAGTLAIPLASRVHCITAIDFSDTMIELLNHQCTQQGLHNIRAQVTGWEDDWDAAGIGVHDVAIASRSLVAEDLQAAINKLASRARQRVYIVSLVGDGPFDRGIFEAIGRHLDRGPDYIYAYNLLHQMGIYAEIRFIFNGGGNKVYQSLDECVLGLYWMLNELTPAEETLLRGYLERHLIPTRGGWKLDYQQSVRWAVLSWNKTP